MESRSSSGAGSSRQGPLAARRPAASRSEPSIGTPAVFDAPLAPLLAVLWFLGVAPPAAHALLPPWRGDLRIQTSFGRDTNVGENLESRLRVADTFARLQADTRVVSDSVPLLGHGELSLRLLGERYTDHPREDRVLGEIRGSFERDLGRSRGGLEAGFTIRDFPDSSARHLRRGWGEVGFSTPLGPRGELQPRLRYWRLDFRDDAGRGQHGFSVDVGYRQPLHRALEGQVGLEIGSVRHGTHAIRFSGDPAMPSGVSDRRRNDSYRLAHVGIQVVRFALLRVRYGFRAQDSNSVDAILDRHEFSWLIARGLPWGVRGQFFGSVERTSYSEGELRDLIIVGAGDPEVGDDDNAVVLRLSRALGDAWTCEVRHAWYRNESLLLQNYYHKRVWSIGLGWASRAVSGS